LAYPGVGGPGPDNHPVIVQAKFRGGGTQHRTPSGCGWPSTLLAALWIRTQRTPGSTERAEATFQRCSRQPRQYRALEVDGRPIPPDIDGTAGAASPADCHAGRCSSLPDKRLWAAGNRQPTKPGGGSQAPRWRLLFTRGQIQSMVQASRAWENGRRSFGAAEKSKPWRTPAKRCSEKMSGSCASTLPVRNCFFFSAISGHPISRRPRQLLLMAERNRKDPT